MWLSSSNAETSKAAGSCAGTATAATAGNGASSAGISAIGTTITAAPTTVAAGLRKKEQCVSSRDRSAENATAVKADPMVRAKLWIDQRVSWLMHVVCCKAGVLHVASAPDQSRLSTLSP